MSGRPPLCIVEATLVRRGGALIRDLDLVLEPGDRLAVMGRSGTGKTTLLKTIAGLVGPERGTVTTTHERVPYVFQEPRLMAWRTVLRNVEFVLYHRERPRARQWLADVGLADVADAYPLTLSGGMRQRVSIARALACQAPLLLVDEPFSHLDVVTAGQLRTLLVRHLATTATAAVWVTHDPAEAVAVADRTLVITGAPTAAWRLVDHHELDDPAAALTDLLARAEAWADTDSFLTEETRSP